MKDLKEKQTFWAEQLPSFKENYICLAQLETVQFNNETGNFDAVTKDATGFELEDILESYHSVNTGWAMWLRAKAQIVPAGYILAEKKNTEDWYLDEDEGLWLEHDGIDGSLCDLSVGEVKAVQHKEYLITQSRTLYAAKVWNHNDDHMAWQFFENEEVAKRAADWCKKMYEVTEAGGSGIKYQIQPVELPENLFNWFHPDIELFDTIEEGAESYTREQWEQLKVNLGVGIETQILDYDDIPNIPDDAIVWSNWKPKPPEDGLFLIASFDSENGPVLWWANPNQVN